MRTRITTVAAIAAAAALVTPAAAQARTKTVDMGTPTKNQKTFFNRYASDVNAFFPNGTTIHVGDRVRFVATGFHSLDLPRRGGKPLPLISSTGQREAGVLDAAGAPFWFDGAADKLGFTPALVRSNFGKTLRFDGRSAARSGVPLANKVKPVSVRFTRAGSYTYYCNVHPGMKGTVTVRRAGSAIPTAAQDRRALARQVSRALASAKRLQTASPPTGTVDVGVAAANGVERFAMVPSALTVNTGQTLTFRMTRGSREVHTATFGPGNPDGSQPSSYLGQVETGFNQPIFDSRAVYPSEAPGAPPATLSPALHGNGFWNSGLMDATATPLPTSARLTFGAPGTYDYYCLVHPFMHGTVTVR